MENYFRITGYWKDQDISFIADSYGFYEKLWQFSSALIQKGIEIIEVSNDGKFLEGDIEKTHVTKNNGIILRAQQKGKPFKTVYTCDGITYKAIQVADKIYVPDQTQRT